MPHFVPNFIQVTPFIIVPDLEKALAFFVDLLDFEVQLRRSDYAYVQRETAGFRIWQQTGAPGNRSSSPGSETGPGAAPPGNRRFAYYIDVHDVDRLYAELKPKLDLLPPGDVHGPADKPYGQRELLLLAPDGNLLAFGHALDKRYTPTGDSRMCDGLQTGQPLPSSIANNCPSPAHNILRCRPRSPNPPPTCFRPGPIRPPSDRSAPPHHKR